jgi:hypothetical protein
VFDNVFFTVIIKHNTKILKQILSNLEETSMENIIGKGISGKLYFYFSWSYFYFSAGYFYCKKIYFAPNNEFDKSYKPFEACCYS